MTYQSKKALRLPHSPTTTEESHQHHDPTSNDEDVYGWSERGRETERERDGEREVNRESQGGGGREGTL